jgi:ATP-dependent Lhr-like helicase
MKTDLIPPERLRLILIESAKARLLNEVRTFICTDCWDYLEMIRIKDLPNIPKCPGCGSTALGVLEEEEDHLQSLIEKKGEKLTKSERKLKEKATETAKLLKKYGKPAAVAFAGRKLRISDVREVLKEESKLTDRFFELMIEAERKALQRRFW